MGAQERTSYMLAHPVEKGMITKWDEMERVWQHMFYRELMIERSAPSDYGILMTENALNPKPDRERMTRILFEEFKVSKFYLAIDAVLSLYASGRTTGVVLDSGYGETRAVAIYEGYCLPHSARQMDLGGSDVTHHLARIVTERGYHVSWKEHEHILDIKKKLCYIAHDYDAELRSADQSAENEKNYEFPDGNVWTIHNERFRAAECLFRPGLIGLNQPGVHRLVYESIMSVDIDVRRDMYRNILLTGGNTMFPGTAERLDDESG